jgi:hypothetical protein
MKVSDISSRITVTKIRKIYDELQQFGFKPQHIENALRATLARDTNSALDWLCLNLSHDDLPPQFAGSRTRSSNMIGNVELIAAKNNKESRKEDQIPSSSQKISSKERPSTSSESSIKKDKQGNNNQEKSKINRWILNYVEEEEVESQLEEEQEDVELDVDFLKMELEEACHYNIYIPLNYHDVLFQAKKRASEAKQSGNTNEQKEANAKIRELLSLINDASNKKTSTQSIAKKYAINKKKEGKSTVVEESKDVEKLQQQQQRKNNVNKKKEKESFEIGGFFEEQEEEEEPIKSKSKVASGKEKQVRLFFPIDAFIQMIEFTKCSTSLQRRKIQFCLLLGPVRLQRPCYWNGVKEIRGKSRGLPNSSRKFVFVKYVSDSKRYHVQGAITMRSRQLLLTKRRRKLQFVWKIHFITRCSSLNMQFQRLHYINYPPCNRFIN